MSCTNTPLHNELLGAVIGLAVHVPTIQRLMTLTALFLQLFACLQTKAQMSKHSLP